MGGTGTEDLPCNTNAPLFAFLANKCAGRGSVTSRYRFSSPARRSWVAASPRRVLRGTLRSCSLRVLRAHRVLRAAVIVCLALLTGTATPATAAPSLTLSTHQIHSGDAILLQGTGFEPNAKLVSRLFRPDGTEYPEMTFGADARGALSHPITIVPVMFGTYEVHITEERTGRVATIRFMMVAPQWPVLAASEASSLPSSFLGVWNGDVVVTGGPRNAASPAMVSLAGGATGTVVGTVAYPARLCGGELWLMGVAGGAIQLGEVITYGAERCAGDGVVTLGAPIEGRTAFLWRDAGTRGAPSGGTGTLALRSEPH